MRKKSVLEELTTYTSTTVAQPFTLTKQLLASSSGSAAAVEEF